MEGDPLASYLFVLAMETLTCFIEGEGKKIYLRV